MVKYLPAELFNLQHCPPHPTCVLQMLRSLQLLRRPRDPARVFIQVVYDQTQFGQKGVWIVVFKTARGASICDIIVDKNPDFLCLREMWHQPNDCLNLNMCALPDYTYTDQPQTTGKVTLPCFPSFECLAFKLNSYSPILVLNIYRSPKLNPVFFSEFTELLTLTSAICSAIVLTGDFNIHVDNQICKNTVCFMKILECFNLTQYVNCPTHKHGHTLDLVCTTGVTTSLSALMYHTTKKHVICFRKIRDINLDTFIHTIGELPVVTSIDQYNAALTSILDKLAP
ncbi:G-protein coupled receptor 84 [Labeo rohita]|uniref:G-protein coupled receptor 84 n=1 Tax=Labeo rohita TaxID=84645 RepID=A0ABQ8LL89_LABRO|nr:G-protein coupled receptor 84 [Labeo rohita]